MNDFVKPKTEYVSDKEYMEQLLNVKLKKDLHGNEEICPRCHGTGLIVVNNPYGLSDDPDKQAGRFPYNHQSLSFCPNCYNGIIHHCELCGEVIQRGYLKHNCQAQIDANQREFERKRKQALIDAPFAPPEVLEKSYFFYSDAFGYNEGYFDDWDEFFDYWYENGEVNGDERPKFVWATEPVEMRIDAHDIISNATEDLYEDAIDNISDSAIKKLQNFLDNWCKTCGVNTTYYESKYKVKIPWEKYHE